MKILVIGSGYVGLPTAVGFAELGNEVICVDNDQSKIDQLNSGKLTIYEKGLSELFKRNFKNGQLTFSNSIKNSITNCNIIFIAVGTPFDEKTGKTDMSFVEAVISEIAEVIGNKYVVIVNKSTVPVGTAAKMAKLLEVKKLFIWH